MHLFMRPRDRVYSVHATRYYVDGITVVVVLWIEEEEEEDKQEQEEEEEEDKNRRKGQWSVCRLAVPNKLYGFCGREALWKKKKIGGRICSPTLEKLSVHHPGKTNWSHFYVDTQKHIHTVSGAEPVPLWVCVTLLTSERRVTHSPTVQK